MLELEVDLVGSDAPLPGVGAGAVTCVVVLDLEENVFLLEEEPLLLCALLDAREAASPLCGVLDCERTRLDCERPKKLESLTRDMTS